MVICTSAKPHPNIATLYVVGVVDISVSGHVPTDGKANTALSYANGPGGLLPGYNRTDPANETTGEAEMISA